MVATTTTILAHNELHPAIQHLFLTYARLSNESGLTFFARPGGFPAYTDRTVPVSTTAGRYYEKGPPALAGYLPYWIATLIDRIWFTLFAIFAIGYPLVKMVPHYRKVYSSLCFADCYEELSELDLHLTAALTPDKLQAAMDKLAELEDHINHLWVPAALFADFYKLRNAVEIVRLKIERLLKP